MFAMIEIGNSLMLVVLLIIQLTKMVLNYMRDRDQMLVEIARYEREARLREHVETIREQRREDKAEGQ